MIKNKSYWYSFCKYQKPYNTLTFNLILSTIVIFIIFQGLGYVSPLIRYGLPLLAFYSFICEYVVVQNEMVQE